MDTLTTVWKLNVFSEDEVCKAYALTPLALREYLLAEVEGFNEPLSVGCKLELRDAYDMGEYDRDPTTLELLAEQYQVPATAIRKAMIGDFKEALDDALTRNGLIRDLLERKVPQKEIASRLGISQGTVSKHTPNRITKQKRRTLTDEQWSELLTQYPRFSITELSRLYKISRAAIYARLGENAE